MDGPHELKTMESAHIPKEGSGSSINGVELEAQSTYDRDRAELARTGKQQVLKRNFGFMSMLGFTCTILVTWEGVLVTFLYGFANGGPAGSVYGFILVWLGSLATFSTLAELSSMAPTSGGQYHWVSMLAPRSYRTILSYMTGWLTVAGWQASVASTGYLCGTLIQGVIILGNPDSAFERWQGTLLFWACIVFAVFFNTFIGHLLPQVEGLILILHVLGFFAVMIPLVALGPHGSAADVFSTFLNTGDWSTQGLSFFVGLIGNVFAFVGVDSAFHMAEEIQNATTVVPRAVVSSVLLNGSLGLGMLIAVLYCLGDIDDALATATGYPFMEIFQQAVNSSGGAIAMTSIIIVLAMCANIALLAASSRMTWSFARDRGLPGWRYLSKVDPGSSIPIISVACTTIIACLLGLINIGSSVALNDVISMTINGLYASYLICASLLLWRRCTGAITLSSDSPQTFKPDGTVQLVWGPWRIPGIFGIITNVFSCIYLIIILFFSFWPQETPVTAVTMNFSVVVTMFVVIFSLVYYMVYAHKFYKGPIVEVENANLK